MFLQWLLHWDFCQFENAQSNTLILQGCFYASRPYTCLMHMHYKTLRKKKITIHQVTTMLAISKYVLFPCHNHLLTTGTDDSSPQ